MAEPQPTEEVGDLAELKSQISELESKVAEVENKNSEKSSHFSSLKIVLAGLKNDNSRLKAENSERIDRHTRLEKLQENLNKMKESNKQLIEIVFKLYSALKSSDFGARHRTAYIEHHVKIQKAMYEKLQQLKNEHENRPIVKKYKEVQELESSLFKNFEILVQKFQVETTETENSLINWDGRIRGQILVLVQNWQTLTAETGVDESQSNLSESNSIPIFSESTCQQMSGQTFSVRNSDDSSLINLTSRPSFLILEEDPEFDKKLVEFKKIVATRTNFTSSSALKPSPMRNFRTSVATLLPHKTGFESKAQTSSTSKVYRVETGPQQVSKIETFTQASHVVVAPSQRTQQRSASNGYEMDHHFPLENFPQNVQLAVHTTTTETIRVTLPSRVDSTLPVALENGSIMRKETIPNATEDRKKSHENKVAITDPKKISVISDVVIKKATEAPISAQSASDDIPNFAAAEGTLSDPLVEMPAVNNVPAIQSLQRQDSINAYHRKLQKLVNISDEVSSSTAAKKPSTASNDTLQKNGITHIHQNHSDVDPSQRPIDRNPQSNENYHIPQGTTTTKQRPQDTANGIKINTKENVVIDLNSELPSSHITINSSTEERQPAQSPRNQFLNFQDDLFSGFNLDMPWEQNKSQKRKDSNGSMGKPRTVDDSFDFGKLDLPKKPKISEGSNEDVDDFLKNFQITPPKAGDTGGGFMNFDDFFNLK